MNKIFAKKDIKVANNLKGRGSASWGIRGMYMKTIRSCFSPIRLGEIKPLMIS